MAKTSTAMAAASPHIVININTVLNVDAIIAQNSNLSKDPSHPTIIGHQNIYMVSDDPRGWSASDPGNITLNANVGDTLSFFANSMTGNSDSAAFIYSISGGSPVLNPSTVNVVTLNGAAQPTAPNGYPAQSVKASFSSCDAKVGKSGTAQNFWVSAALFQLDSTGEIEVLAGYVTWDPTVIVP